MSCKLGSGAVNLTRISPVSPASIVRTRDANGLSRAARQTAKPSR
ncbi:19008_t:CDS:2 [Cetraspora pellucida]|uniref:19008_t:CDS:1 n=1 Tax=Cetraspora pellucida TaxID=1433469 RepID=A0A9N8YSS2_9GLOM|nr:19008_t:CDS:2 [Cetraspora pellucida]